MLSKNQKFDLSRFIARIKGNCDSKGVMNITLKKGGITISQLNSMLGSGYSAKENGDCVTVAKVRGPLAKFIS